MDERNLRHSVIFFNQSNSFLYWETRITSVINNSSISKSIINDIHSWLIRVRDILLSLRFSLFSHVLILSLSFLSPWTSHTNDISRSGGVSLRRPFRSNSSVPVDIERRNNPSSSETSLRLSTIYHHLRLDRWSNNLVDGRNGIDHSRLARSHWTCDI